MRPNARSDLIDIACKVRRRSEKSIAIADGSTEEITDSRTGEVKEREKWFWLPISLVEINDEDSTVTMPLWLAQERGLI